MINISRLLQQLNNTGLQNKDTPLYQLLKELIRTLNSVNVTASEAISNNTTGVITQIIQGSPGLDGMDGNDGMSIIGAKGDTGSTGSIGLTGAIGARGFDGIDGEDGLSIPGPKGDTGLTGATGASGASGTSSGSISSDSDGYDNDLMTYPNPIGPFTTGSVLFWNNKIAEDNPNLYWDDANNRLGIGTNTPGSGNEGDGNAYSLYGAVKSHYVGGMFLFVPSSGAAAQGVMIDPQNMANGSNVLLIQAPSTWTGALISGNRGGSNKFSVSELGNAFFAGNLTYGTSSAFSWNAKSVDTVYQALSDGLVVFSVIDSLVAGIYTGVTDSSNPPTTYRCVAGTSLSTGTIDGSFTMPVKKGDYWKVITSSGSGTITLYWVPFGLNG